MNSENTYLKARNGLEMTEILNIFNSVRERIKKDYPENLQLARNDNKIWKSANEVYDYSCLFIKNNDLSIYELIKFNAPDIENITAYWVSNFNQNSQKLNLTEGLIKKIFCRPLTLDENSNEDLILSDKKWILKKTVVSDRKGFDIKYILTHFIEKPLEEIEKITFSGRIY